MSEFIIVLLVNGLVFAGLSLRFLGVTFTFQVINLALLLMLAAYLFAKYFLPKIKGNIYSNKQKRKKMKQHASNLSKKKKEIAHAIQEQKEYIKTLDLKLNAWETHFERAKAKRKKEKKEITHAMNERVQKQFEHMEVDYTRELVLPEAIEKAEQELVEQFDNPKAGEAFLTDLIKSMNKEVQQ